MRTGLGRQSDGSFRPAVVASRDQTLVITSHRGNGLEFCVPALVLFHYFLVLISCGRLATRQWSGLKPGPARENAAD